MIYIKGRSISVDFSAIMSWFFIYSFIGWIYETMYCSLSEGHYVSRGFLYGPFIPIYGLCIVSTIILLYDKRINKLALFVICAIVASIFEYITSLWMESVFDKRWWDYSNEMFNINGRICLGAALVFGFFGVVILRYLHPALERLMNYFVPMRLTKKTIKIIAALFIIDVLASFLSA